MWYYVRITAEMSQILVSCETLIQWEHFTLEIHTASGTLFIYIMHTTMLKHELETQ